MSDEPEATQPPHETRGSGLSMPMIIVIGAILIAVLVAVPAAILLAGGSSDSDGRDATPTVIDQQRVTINIRDFKFDPSNVIVTVGSTVTWVNHDNAPHDATDDDDAWKTERLDQEGRGAVTFDEPGEYDYHCSIHPYMKATLSVAE
ncbi:MAG TPA: cupredoxin family copper-binding protein [Dehalococcoidia bacterium]|nr:cupredoxin family copper-binding protein [Dehalococcoidia bacterium]